MSRLPRLESLSLAEYLAGEAKRNRRYEYLDGQLYPLPEPPPAHERLRQNLSGLVGAAAKAERSRFYRGEMRLKVGPNRVYYPDLMVVSQPQDNPQYEEYPALLVEIATWETERTDRGEKLLVYQTVPALQAYLIVHAERRVVELLERGLRGNWRYEALGQGGELELYSPQVKLGLDQIYEGVEG